MQISDARNNGAGHIAGAQGREQQQRRGLKGSAPFPFAGTPCRLAITSWMCPKQDLALRIKTAFSRYEPGVTQASIIERTVPSASLSPFRPCDVVAILAVRISRFPGRTKDALSGAAWTGDYVAAYRRGSCQHRNKNGSNANQSEFRHAFLPLPPVCESHRFKLRTTWPPALSLAGRKSLNRPRLAYDPRRLLISRFRR